MSIFEELQGRGLIQDLSDPELFKKLPKEAAFYVGFDPSAPSLQIGNLAILFTALRLARVGYKPVILFGGATGAIGDPKLTTERPLMERAEIDRNVANQMQQVEALFKTFSQSVRFVNNLDWFKDISALEFLRDTGKYFTVNYMLAKDTVKTRLAGEGISYTEFSYMLLQALDFSYLYDQFNCKLQIGASDQWGNITAGLELIRKKQQGEAFGFTIPLVTDSSGKKFGKSEGNAVWLDSNLTSPYRLHQYFLNVPDSEVIKLLKVYAFIELPEIACLEKALAAEPEKRAAQQVLADHLCELLHGATALQQAKHSAQVLFGGGSLGDLDDRTLLDIFAHVPGSDLDRTRLKDLTSTDLFILSSLAKSKGEARRLIDNGGAYINNLRVERSDQPVSELLNLNNNLIVLRSGKKSYHLIKLL